MCLLFHGGLTKVSAQALQVCAYSVHCRPDELHVRATASPGLSPAPAPALAIPRGPVGPFIPKGLGYAVG